jgi:L-lactate dehydrogenase complex protein LldG
MNSKNEILSRLRQRGSPDRDYNAPQWEDKDLFADFPGPSDNLINIFSQQLNKLSGDFHLVNNKEEMVKTLQNLLEDSEPEQCKAHKSPLIDELKILGPEIRDYLTFIDGDEISSEEFAKLEVGITGADCLIARTGSILLHTLSAGGRRLSVLPPTHIVIAEEKQIVPSLDEAFNTLDLDQDIWSYATIITGPSRTSDIEKQLVLGAHGPKRLIVILLKN